MLRLNHEIEIAFVLRETLAAQRAASVLIDTDTSNLHADYALTSLSSNQSHIVATPNVR